METQQGIAGDEIDVDTDIDTAEAPVNDQYEDTTDLLYPDDEAEEQGEGEEAQADDEAAEDDADAPEPVAAPVSWSKEDKEEWDSLSRKTQEVIARREGERDKLLRAKTVEAAQVRQTVETEAREIVSKLYENHATQLQAYAQQIMPSPPDRNMLYSTDPNEVLSYHRQKDAYEAGVAQQRELHQQIAQAQAQANSAREQSHQAELASDAQRLKEALPEWFDPSASVELKQQLQSVGEELGYPMELMSQASSVDILALKKAAEWKADAAKYKALMSKKMSAVSKARFLPKVTARPGSSAVSKGGDDILKTLYPND